MRHRLLLPYACACLLACAVMSAPPVRAADAPDPADAAAARRVLDEVAAAWNAHDMDRHAALLTPDADWVNIRVQRWTGREAVHREHVGVHRALFSRSHVTFSNVAVRRIAPGVLVVHARETMRDTDVPARAGVGPDSELSLVLVQRDGQWKIANGHNTNVAPPPPGAAPPSPTGG